jgi:nucleoside-diphosphate-sugar epimerase
MNRVLLLGGTGFIGSAVLARLRQRNDVRVMLLGHLNVDYRELEDVDLIVGSLSNFDLTWIDVFEPDTILHLARMGGRTSVGRRLAATRGWFANRRLIGKLLQLKAPPRVVYVSGTLVYGDRGEEWVDERSPIFPVAYARQYIVAERPWMAAQASGDLPVMIVRPPWVVGSTSWFATYYAGVLARDGVAPCYGDGDNWMTFLDVDDCAGLILHVAERGTSGNSYNILAPGQHVRQRDFAAFLAAVAGTAVSFIDRRTVARRLEAGAAEALTTSTRSTTFHDAILRTYSFNHLTWEVFVERHLSAILKSRTRLPVPISQSA